MRGQVLIVDDDRAMCDLLTLALEQNDFSVAATTDGEDALARLAGSDFDMVVTDLNMRGMNGLCLCERITAGSPGVPVVVITAFGSLDTAIAAIRAGAYDFLTKPFDTEQLLLIVQRAVTYRTLQQEVKRLRRAVGTAGRFEGFIGESPAMRRVYDLIGRVAESEASVLITGETGTGKEIAARAIHERGRRTRGPFVAVNCGSIPETLLESELFGHVKGAFTDARSTRKGLFVEADGGTLLLDEIGDMPAALQARLLRVLQERRVRPVGGDTDQPVDVRIVSATHHDLETAVEEGRFRRDLLFRLNVVQIHLPPLRARGNDVLLLAQHFIRHFAARADKHLQGLSCEAAEKLLTYAWPGNVRELQNSMERAAALTRYEQITVEDLPEKLRNYAAPQLLVFGDDPEELIPMEQVERRYILRVLEAAKGNKTVAAQILGLDRRTLYRKLERYLSEHQEP